MRTPADARSRYRGFIQRVLACVSPTVFCRVLQLGGNAIALDFADGPLELPTRAGHSLHLVVLQNAFVIRDDRFPGEWKVSTARYQYSVYDTADVDGTEPLVRWHWDRADDNWSEPHVHVAVKDPLGKGVNLHIPTGKRVSVEQVISFLIRDMGVIPGREDWEEVISDTQARFDRYQTQDPR